MKFKDEAEYKAKLVAALHARGWRMQAHEDKRENYIADLSFSANFIDGWIEVKYCDRAPKTLGSIKHWTKGQEKWLCERGRAGSGHCYLLVGTPLIHVLWKHTVLNNDLRTMSWAKAAGWSLFWCNWKALAVSMDSYIRLRSGPV